MSILGIKDLNISFGGLQAVSNVSFLVKEGTIKAVIGAEWRRENHCV